jgi:cytochrome c oxidase subunit 2
VDHLFLAFSALVIALTAPVFILQVIYVILYRRGRPADRSPRTDGNVLLEVSWSVIPFLLTLGFFVWSGWLFFEIGRPPADALRIDVEARQWMWKFEHPGGQREINELHVPAGEPVKLVMISQDVIHSLYLPALRLKQDVLPGRYETTWFSADRPGVYPIRCAEFCGFDHSMMGGRVVVMAQADYARWLRQAGTDGSLAQQGFSLFRARGCSGCHEGNSSRRAPPLEGIYGRPVALDGGQVVMADDQYIRDSILDPNRQVAAGYTPIMPSFAGQLTEAELIRLTAYIKSLGADQPKARAP